ncbi:MAG: dephospho-CoA kinase [Bacteriovoracaceae bacterium]|nr:dephospho-CoA kinase [Bacteroidota bacterium]
MIVIGVTGGIGSGKSTICTLFEKKQVPVFYADLEARKISETTALNEIVDIFGNEILSSPTSVNRKKLAEIVFHDRLKLENLNSIIHPKVFESFHRWKDELPPQTKYALVEAALMFESGMFALMHYVLAVMTNEQTRITRTISRDHADEQVVKARMENQLSTEELLELSDFQINNNGSLNDLTAKVNFFSILFSTLTAPPESL